jgi:hypothetical protein
MFAWIKSTLFGALGPVLRFFASAFNPLMAIVLAVIAAITKFGSMATEAVGMIGQLKSSYVALNEFVGSTTFGMLPGQLSSVAAFANHFVPLTEMVFLAGIAAVLYTLSVALRVLKGWIPGMN